MWSPVKGYLCVLGVALLFALAASSVARADVHMVTNTEDSGQGSLRQCIEDADPGDEIHFDPSLDGQPIVLTGHELLIDKDLIITGRGADTTILSGNSLQVTPEISVELSAVTVTRAGYGIINEGAVILSDSVIRNNAVGILNWAFDSHSATMVVNDSHITGNDYEGIDNWGSCSDFQCSAATTINYSTIRQNAGSGIRNIDFAGWVGAPVGANVSVTINHSVISENGAGDPYDSIGGGISNWFGKVTIAYSTISNNVAWMSGGGILTQGDLLVHHSTIEGNEAPRADYECGGHGGGIYHASGHAEIRDSTISNNSAACGGAIGLGDFWSYPFAPRSCWDSEEPATLAVRNSTITQSNTSGCWRYVCWQIFPIGWHCREVPAGSGAIHGSGSREVSFENSIVADQSQKQNCYGGALSLGHNLDSDGTCGFNHHTDSPNTDPMLGPLQDNGGSTLTHAPLEGSLVIDRGVCIAPTGQVGDWGFGLPLTDQRGVRRPIDGDRDGVLLCDIGAVEYRPPPVFEDFGDGGDDIQWPDPD